MAPRDPDTLVSLTGGLLAAASACWPGAPTREAPALQYVEHVGFPNQGAVMDGCDRLVVFVTKVRLTGGRTSVDPAEGKPTQRPLARVVDLRVEVHRCGAPSATAVRQSVVLPTPAEIEAHADAMNRDGWYLLDGLLKAQRAGLFSACSSVLWGDLQPVGPEGGIAGWRLPLSVQL